MSERGGILGAGLVLFLGLLILVAATLAVCFDDEDDAQGWPGPSTSETR